MDIEKKIIKLVFPVYANYMETWPDFFLSDIQGLGAVCLELTKEEVDEYRHTVELYSKWQKIIKERAFPDLEDY